MKAEQREALIDTLKLRFKQNLHRHPGVDWADVHGRLQDNPDKLRSLHEMERTGGEPDVIGAADDGGAYLFCDCVAESPQGRRSLCYDAEALNSRKQNKPQDNAIDMAAVMGVSLLTEAQYRELQQFGEFDTKTSSWVSTPPDIRRLGGALFCDRRFGKVFVYHNGAESYYAARGFRGSVSV
ncbi:DUF4256 domain-containing protein [Variovorax ginsengisoli]|uniref:DUF4256 domain-containing protein n=1 Tax=Variovorax ginsengisoli TaxID=363844 RepID=A0ABT8RXQ0_9BURK|nr:DUF4256 domain-containing protein [Variovorax ginsengisoli]MDN8612275.1 DUF4256 domain-containing protein [Variovorax ginsengisoli]MDO1531445.1 DUF4256 domain-containing protein [Variovorax ginsengisoli]